MARPNSGLPSIGFVSTWPIYQGTTIDRHAHALIEGICAAARDRNCRLVIGAGVSPVAERSRWRTVWPVPAPDIDFVPVGPWNMDGLIIVSDDLTEEQARHVRDMQESGIPVVFTTPEGPGPRVVVDNKAGIRSAVEHLLRHGHRDMAFIAGTHHQGGDSAERLRTLRDALEEAGIPADEQLVAYGEHRYGGGQAAMERILATGRQFSAFVASNDLSCLGAIEALRRAGRRVPSDVAAIGFDDILDARSSSPPLTTVRHPTFALGYQALLVVLEHLSGRADDERVVVPTRLITRESCGCPGHADPPLRGEDVAAGRELTGLPRRMAEAAFVDARHSTVDELDRQCNGIVDALNSSLERRDEAPLRDEVARQLTETEARGEDAHVWQAAISQLYSESEALLEQAPAVSPNWFMGLLDGARLAISENVQRRTTHALLRHVDMMSELGLLTAQLIAAHDVEETRDILERMLPRLGIDHFLVVRFAGNEEDPVGMSEVLMASGLRGELPDGRFPSRDFPPRACYPNDGPIQLLVLPLSVDAGISGFVALPTTGLEPAAAIVNNLATAIRASRLYDDAVEGRRMAEEASRLKSRFLSMVSHELRTPLAVVVGLSDMVLRESRQAGELSSSTITDLERLSTSAQHLGRLIGDVIDLASSEAGQLRLARESVDLVEVLDGLCGVGELMAREKGLSWRTRIRSAGCVVIGDRTRLRQVVLNLITNAVKYTQDGTVEVGLELEDDAAVITVSDTGSGIAPHERHRVFEEFYRSGGDGVAGGLGLGLAISRQLVEHHGGSIDVRSRGADGQGSTFSVRLPLADVELDGPRPDESRPEVLALAAAPFDQSPLVRELRERGIAVTTTLVTAAEEAVARVAEARPDAVLLVGDLGATLGWNLVRALRSMPGFEAVPLIACSGGPGLPDGGALELNYLLKPLGIDDFARAMAAGGVSAGPGAKPTILVVDDDPDLRRLHARVVEQAGAQPREAADGFEALALMERQLPDLVLLDLVMPQMDGFAVLDAMRARASMRDIPVVVVTGQSLTDDDVERLSNGVASILSKGIFTAQETVARIEAALSRRRLLGGATQLLVRRASAFIHAHHAEPITRDDIAAHVALSPDYLTDCFHKELGVTPIAYLNRCRLSEARSLLESSDLSITEIALRVGFSDVSHFTRMFHRETGVSPRAYRRGERIEPGIDQELPAG